jgi:glucosamine-6-phosphate deaminase
MGAELVYRAKTVVLLASGERKVQPVTESLVNDPTPDVPISYGQKYSRRGGRLTYVVDKTAGRGLLTERRRLKQKGIILYDRSL